MASDSPRPFAPASSPSTRVQGPPMLKPSIAPSFFPGPKIIHCLGHVLFIPSPAGDLCRLQFLAGLCSDVTELIGALNLTEGPRHREGASWSHTSQRSVPSAAEAPSAALTACSSRLCTTQSFPCGSAPPASSSPVPSTQEVPSLGAMPGSRVGGQSCPHPSALWSVSGPLQSPPQDLGLPGPGPHPVSLQLQALVPRN